MKISELSIHNFRGIPDMNLFPDQHINLIVGVNGAGKSTVLDAISCLLSWYIARINNPKGNGNVISLDDIHHHTDFCEISIKTDISGRWSLLRKRPYNKTDKGSKSDFTDMMEYIRGIRSRLDETQQLCSIPVMAHYQVNRSVTNIPLKVRKHKRFDVLDTYENALDGVQGFRRFFEWYREREDLENEGFRYNESHTEDMQLKAVRSALTSFFPEYTHVRIQRNPLAMVLEKKGEKFNIAQLSDGEKCYISLVSDLSRRLAIANPILNNPLEGEGIVLIDEIELHLHPQWQMEVIAKLKKTFPNCQFFITTHSPHVVSDIKKEQLVLINEGQKVSIGLNTYGKLVNDILTDYFGIRSPRSLEVQVQIDEAKSLLLNNEVGAFEEKMKWLEKSLGKGDIDVVALKLEAARRNQE